MENRELLNLHYWYRAGHGKGQVKAVTLPRQRCGQPFIRTTSSRCPTTGNSWDERNTENDSSPSIFPVYFSSLYSNWKWNLIGVGYRLKWSFLSPALLRHVRTRCTAIAQLHHTGTRCSIIMHQLNAALSSAVVQIDGITRRTRKRIFTTWPVPVSAQNVNLVSGVKGKQIWNCTAIWRVIGHTTQFPYRRWYGSGRALVRCDYWFTSLQCFEQQSLCTEEPA